MAPSPRGSSVNGSFRVTSFADLKVGDEASLRKEFTAADVDAFARLSGDFNPLHVDDEFAQHTRFRRRIAPGMLSGAYISRLIGMQLPGPGALWLQQRFDFVAPIFVGDCVEFRAWVDHKSEATRTLVIRVEGRNQKRAVVMRGEGKVMMLTAETSPRGARGGVGAA